MTVHYSAISVFFPVLNGGGSCKYDDPVGSAEFQACLRLGDRFIKRQAKSLRRGRNAYCLYVCLEKGIFYLSHTQIFTEPEDVAM